MFSHTKFQGGINICHIIFLQCVRINLHSSSLINIESFISPARFALEKKKEKKIMAIAKLFCVTCKRNKDPCTVAQNQEQKRSIRIGFPENNSS